MKAKCLMIIIAAACAAAGCSGQTPDAVQSKAAYTNCLRQNSAEPSRCAVPNEPLPESGSTSEPVISF